jgi:hypothetical protein
MIIGSPFDGDKNYMGLTLTCNILLELLMIMEYEPPFDHIKIGIKTEQTKGCNFIALP